MAADKKKPEKILLHFNEQLNSKNTKIHSELSSVVRTGDYLWLAFDEGVSLERLKKNKDGYAEHTSFPLKKYIKLPGSEDGEVDIEGLAYGDHYLWLVGSHSLKRDKPDKRSEPTDKRIERLSKVENDPNRYTLARIPVIPDPETGEYKLFKSCPHPDHPDRMLTAAKLKAGKKSSQLSKLLKKDEHLKSFMHLPSKENGFDIEGIAVMGERIFLGLRGPVLRGWAIILEIMVQEKKKGKLKLKKIGKGKGKYRKHFFHLQGMGIRELAVANDDLLVLAGPTMDCDGTIAMYRIKNGIKDRDESLTYNNYIDRLFNVTIGHETKFGTDKAEGLTMMEDGRLMVIYDAPAEGRVKGDSSAYADIFAYE